jgi:hypothetical protein
MLNAIMAQAHSWETSETLQKFLAEQLLRGRLALVLGAGISVPFGLPDWDALITRMYKLVGDTPPLGLTPPKAAEFFLIKHCGDDKVKYHDYVTEALYDKVDINFWTSTPGLMALGTLVMASHRGSASTVITFNFDDILEMYLEFHGFVVSSISSPQHWADNADVRIFHPHGLLPMRPDTARSQDIVLDEASFSRALSPVDGRLWRERLLSVMRSHTCLFIGIGGSDSNLESFLHDCRESHVGSSEQIAFWGVRFTTADHEPDKLLWGARGVATYVIADYERALPEFLLGICQRAARLRSDELRI